MDAIQFIKQEHTKAKAAFAKLMDATPAKRANLWNELQPELKAHEEIEEACLYGPLLDEGPSDPKLEAWVADGHSDHVEKVESLIEQTESLDPKDETWLATVRKIHAALESHIREEEGEISSRGPVLGSAAAGPGRRGNERHEGREKRAALGGHRHGAWKAPANR